MGIEKPIIKEGGIEGDTVENVSMLQDLADLKNGNFATGSLRQFARIDAIFDELTEPKSQYVRQLPDAEIREYKDHLANLMEDVQNKGLLTSEKDKENYPIYIKELRS